ncbi:MAG: 4-hydroxy-3-methylbut-2-enyl diphosphate reductase [Syntrophales bacterium]|nr:4-hydroxy-3-methylbut-2-enyl diphosphate reductase [Syntrophales bacterium]
MPIKIAPSAGFCMGVKRAVDMVLDLARHKENGNIYTYGPLIHNPQTVEILKRRGIVSIENEEDLKKLPAGSLVVVRAHGISPVERHRLKELGLKIVDATCPRVGHVQAIIKKFALQNYLVVIFGDRAHPEVRGLLGYAGEKGWVINSLEEVQNIPAHSLICVVSQTTQNHEKYASIVSAIKQRFPHATVFDTICDSTEMRQKEVAELAHEMDMTIIVGGKNSANTRHLATLAARAGKPVHHVETADELPFNEIRKVDNVGISAGASTPNWIIERVIEAIAMTHSRRQNMIHLLYRTWRWAVKTDLFSALGAGILTFTACLWGGIAPSVIFFSVASTYVFSMHTINRFIDREASTIIGSFREEMYRRREKTLLWIAFFSLVTSILLSSLLGFLALSILIALLAGGLLYTVKLLPRRWKFRSLRDIPGSKNVVMALAWATVTAVIPFVSADNSPEGPILPIVFISGLVFLRSIISDLQDIQSDKFIGRETIPVLIGSKLTNRLINVVALILLILLVTSHFVGWTSSLSLFLTPVIFYLWICNWLYVRKPQFSGLNKEGLLELSYYLSGLGTVGWMLWNQLR